MIFIIYYFDESSLYTVIVKKYFMSILRFYYEKLNYILYALIFFIDLSKYYIYMHVHS